MLTVKHMHPGGGDAIHSAKRVTRVPAKDGVAEQVWIDTPDDKTVCLGAWGAFYVMNDFGKTVAKYDLGGWLTPEEAGAAEPNPVFEIAA